MLQVVRRRDVAPNQGALHTQSKAFDEFKRAFRRFSRKERQVYNTLLALAATNLFAVCGAVSFFLLASK